MLSYQHAYHAGNLADVHKHAALAWVLDYMGQKDKPLTYFETHAGRGLYSLDSEEAAKTGEAAKGVERVLRAFPSGHPYRKVVERVRKAQGARAYPGSPVIAGEMMRPGDAGHVAELHPQEYDALSEVVTPYALIAHKRDGFELALSLTPPEPRRGLMLIDPSYEVKTDYEALPHFLYKQHRKWNVGVLMLWYPILTSGVHDEMAKVLDACNFPGAVHHQVRFPAARKGHGMVGSGLFVVNAPYGLDAELAAIAKRIG